MRYFKGNGTLKVEFNSIKERRNNKIEEFKERFMVDFTSYSRVDGPIITENNNPKIKLKRGGRYISKATKEGKEALKWWDENVDTKSLTLERVIFSLYPFIEERHEIGDIKDSYGINTASIKVGLGIVDIIDAGDCVYFATEWDEIGLPLKDFDTFTEITKKEFYSKKAGD